MRTIRFRAWDRNERDSYRMKNNLSLNSAYFQQETLKDVEVMQYTGLKDRNGKEIYERDIIRCFDTDGEKVYDQVVEIPKVFQEIWGNGADCEVIGNICEHPDLLAVVNENK